jgi:hypothetical protein
MQCSDPKPIEPFAEYGFIISSFFLVVYGYVTEEIHQLMIPACCIHDRQGAHVTKGSMSRDKTPFPMSKSLNRTK